MLRLLTLAIGLQLAGICLPLLRAQTTGDTDCQKANTTAEMRTCENARYHKADEELNMVYQKLIRTLNDSQRGKLRLAQRAWLQFREAEAEFQASQAEGGTLAPLLKVSALADMTESRTGELRKEMSH